jgi:hypothetical protein
MHAGTSWCSLRTRLPATRLPAASCLFRYVLELPVLLACRRIGKSLLYGTNNDSKRGSYITPCVSCCRCAGFVSCGVVVLLADLLLKRGPYYTPAGMARLFQVVVLQTCIGLAAAAAVLRRNWKRLAAAGPAGSYSSSSSSSGLYNGGLGFGRSGSDKQIIGLAVGSVAAGGLRSGLAGVLGLRHRSDLPVCASEQALPADAAGAAAAGVAGATAADSAIGAAATAVAIHLGGEQQAAAAAGMQLRGSSRGSGGGKASRQPKHVMLLQPLRRVIARVAAATVQLQLLLRIAASIWPAALGLLLSVGSSMLAFPFFTFVPHSGTFREHLPQVGMLRCL